MLQISAIDDFFKNKTNQQQHFYLDNSASSDDDDYKYSKWKFQYVLGLIWLMDNSHTSMTN